MNGSASDINLSPAAGWVGGKAMGRGLEYSMHPATAQQFAFFQYKRTGSKVS